MSTSGLTNNFIPSTLDGLVVINADAIAINGQDIDIDSLVPYENANKAVNLGSQPIRTNYAPVANSDLVNLLALQNAVVYIEGVSAANFVKYTGSNDNVDLAAFTISSSTAPSTGNNLTNKTYVDTKDALKVPYSGATANVDLSTYTISSSTAPASGNVLTNKTYVDTQDALRVPYTGGTSNVVLSGTNKFQQDYNALTSDTTTLVNRQTLDSAISGLGAGILTLNNTWTGTNTFNNTVSVSNRLLGLPDASPTGNFWMGLRGSGTEADRLAIAIAGDATTGAVSLIGLNKPTTVSANLTVNGDFRKEGGNSGANWCSIRGTDTFNSPYLEFFVNSLRRSYIGYATTTSMNVFTENGANLQLGTEGITRMVIDTAGDTSTTGKLTVQDVVRFGNYSGGNYDNIQFMRGTGSGQYPNIRCQDNYIAMYVSDANGWVAGSQVGDMVIKTETGNIRLGIAGTAGLVLDSSNNVKLIGTLTVAETSLIGFTTPPTSYPFTGNKDLWVNGSIYSAGTNAMVATFGRNTTAAPYNDITFVSNSAGTLSAQIKSHTTGSSIFNDATWTYSNTNPNPLGSNQGQVLLQADKMSMSLTSGFIVGGLANIHGGSPSAVPSGFMATGSLTIGDVGRNYGGGTGWTSNTAGLLMECLDNTEIMVHDAGTRVSSFMNFTSASNTFTMGRDAGWGLADVVAANNLKGACLVVNGGGTYQEGCIYSDANWGMLFRAKVVPAAAHFGWYNSVGGELMKLNTAGELVLAKDGAGFVQSNGTIVVETYVGGSGNGGWYGTRTNHPLMFYTNNASAQMTLKTDGSMTHTTGDNSYMKYGPNATWSSYLVVGATPDRAGASTAQVISTNGNLHLDAGNSLAIYYGYYANSRGTPNPHYFYGGDYQFNSTPQNEYPYAHVACFFGDRLRRSQCMMREIYKVDYIAWGGGINMVAAFYKYNAIAPVKVSGKYSGYVASGNVLATMVVRIYSQSSGVYRYYPFITYQNQAYVQTTYPFELILSSAMIPETGWFDIYVYSSFALITDINNQLHVNVQLLPVDAF